MSYSLIEAGIATVIKKHTDFSDANVFQGDFRGLGKGLARLIVITFESTSKVGLSIQNELHTWITNVDIFVPWRGEAYELEQRITTESQKLQDEFGKYPRLDGVSGVINSSMSAGARPDIMSIKKTTYKGKRYTVTTREAVNPGRLE